MKLSDRLASIANEIKKGETMADIGCDHGFLPLDLIERKISPKTVIIDISPGSLDKAKKNFEKYKNDSWGNSICDFRLGDGLGVVEEGEVDKIVIAGMGGILIADILGGNIKKAKLAKALILQPRNSASYLRKWLYDNNFEVTKEKLVREGKFICQIIVCHNGTPSRHENYEYPSIYALKDWERNTKEGVLDADYALLEEYLNNQLSKETLKLDCMKKAKRKDNSRINKQIQTVDRVKQLLEVKNENQ